MPENPDISLKRLLVVDDDPLGQAVMEQILSDEYELLFAKNGLEGIRSAEKNMPDLILLDIEMPVMGGYETIEKLKSDPKTRNIPVIFVSHLIESYNEEKGLIMGASDYIIKPVRSGVMLVRIQNVLNIHEKMLKRMLKEQDETADNPVSEKRSYLKPEQIDGLKKVLDHVLIKDELYVLEDLRVAQVASAMGIKSHHLQELLNSHLNISFIQMLNKVRVEKAISLMHNNPEKKIIDIANETGFQSKSAFNRAFKNITGLSPTEFKETGQIE